MALAKGFNSWFGYGPESAWGTAVAATHFQEMTDEGIELKQKLNLKSILGNRSQRYGVPSKRTVGGPVKFPMIYQGAELLLKHLLGLVSSAQIGSTGVYTHTFTLATEPPAGLTVVMNRDATNIGGSSCFQYDGCQISKATFSQELEEFLAVEIEFEGREESLIALPSPTFPTFKGVMYQQVSTLTVGGTAIPATMSEISFEQGLATDRFKLGTALRKGIGAGDIRKISGKLSLEFEDTTQYAFFRSLSTAGALSSIWTGGIAAGSTPYRLAIAATNVIYDGKTPPVKGPGPITLELPFQLPIADGGAANSEFSMQIDNLLTSVS